MSIREIHTYHVECDSCETARKMISGTSVPDAVTFSHMREDGWILEARGLGEYYHAICPECAAKTGAEVVELRP